MRTYKLTLTAVLVVGLILHIRMLWSQWDQVVSGSGDFVAFYTAGKLMSAADFTAFGDFATQRNYQLQFNFPGQTEFLPFYHAPYQAVIFWPLSYFSYPAAHLIWSAFTLVLLALVFGYLLPFLDKRQGLLFGLILFGTYPTWLTFIKGQDSIMSALIMVFVFRSLKRGHESLAGSLLALGLYKPQLVLPLAGILTLGRRWRATISFILVGLFLTVVSILMLSWNGAIALVSTITRMMGQGVLDYSVFMPNLRGLASMFLNRLEATIPIATAAVSGILYVGCLVLCKDKFRVNNESFDLQFSLVIVTTLLINPHSHAYELVLVAIALILIFNFLLQQKSQWTHFHHCILPVLFLFCVPVIPNAMVSLNLLALAALPMLFLCYSLGMEIRATEARDRRA